MSIDLYTTYQSTPCHLYYVPEKRVVVKFPKGLDGNAEFTKEESIFEEAMEKSGVPVPIEKRGEFSKLKDRKASVIYLNEPGFGKAFIKFRYPEMNQSNYVWQKN